MLKNKARIGWVVGGLIAIAIFIVAPVYFSKYPISADWVGMGKSDEKSQVTTEKVDGKITKTITTTKFEQAKTLWDWLSLLGAPATLAVFGFAFQASQERAKVAREKADREVAEATQLRADEQAKVEKARVGEQVKAEKERAEKQDEVEKERAEKQAKLEKARDAQQAKAEKERNEDRQRDDALEVYINNLSDLLVGKGLSLLVSRKERGRLTTEEQDLLDASMNVIRATTLSIFRRFTDDKDPERTDGERKGSILLFLYETGLIRDQDNIVQRQEVTELKRLQAQLSLFGAILDFAEGL